MVNGTQKQLLIWGLITLVVGLIAMSLGTFLSGETETSQGWVIETFKSGYHFMGAVFVGLICLQLALGFCGMTREEPYRQKDAQAVDLTPWRPARLVGLGLVTLALTIYVVFAF